MTVVEYITPSGRCPYRLSLERLDRHARARIQERLDRFERGNLGDTRAVSGGVYEARFTFGPGYRLYYGRDGASVILLLLVGDKSSQKRDIVRARWLWTGYLTEKRYGSSS